MVVRARVVIISGCLSAFVASALTASSRISVKERNINAGSLLMARVLETKWIIIYLLLIMIQHSETWQ
ncbi:MAG: hypothetical protein L3J59_10025 [Methylococcaceae bacterium]|nr:hypothetical protein [Methylococcaceae bacterium]